MADPRHPTALDADRRASDVFERALFDSAQSDTVPARSRERVAVALGIGSPAGSGLDGALARDRAAQGTSPVTAGGGPGRALGAAGSSRLVVVAGGLAALVFLGGSEAERAASNPASAPSHVAAPSSPTLEPLVAAATVVETPPAPSRLPAQQSAAKSSALSGRSAEPSAKAALETSDRATTSRRSRKSAADHRTGAPSSEADSRLLEEVAALDRARALLAASDPRLALEQLRRYSAEFPGGVLAQEARRLEARARSRVGGSSQAARDIEGAR